MSQVILDSASLKSEVEALSAEVFTELGPNFEIIGIAEGGAKVASMMHQALKENHHYSPRIGTIDITLYRDDLYTGLERPAMGVTDIPFQIDSCSILLVDDVIFTGRTVRSALQELGDLGRPSDVKLAVLLDRGHRELPIQPDYCRILIPTKRTDRIEVNIGDQDNCVLLQNLPSAEGE